MNFLAHCLLSKDNKDWMVGNYLTDLITQPQMDALPDQWKPGVRLHRKIDWFVDHHPSFKAAVALIKPTFKRYSPVILDVYSDYLLTRHWNTFSSVPLDDFEDHVYVTLEASISHFPGRSQRITQAMISDRWVDRYRQYAGIHFVFEKLEQRVKFKQEFTENLDFLKENEAKLTSYFLQYFTTLKKYVDWLPASLLVEDVM